MKIVIIGTMTAVIFAGSLGTALAKDHRRTVLRPDFRAYSALRIGPTPAPYTMPTYPVLHGPTMDSNSTATGGPSGGIN